MQYDSNNISLEVDRGTERNNNRVRGGMGVGECSFSRVSLLRNMPECTSNIAKFKWSQYVRKKNNSCRVALAVFQSIFLFSGVNPLF